jgi:hypothetical protein
MEMQEIFENGVAIANSLQRYTTVGEASAILVVALRIVHQDSDISKTAEDLRQLMFAIDQDLKFDTFGREQMH